VTALGVAIYFDLELASNTLPFGRLVETLFSNNLDCSQFSIPIENVKAKPPKKLQLDNLLNQIEDGVVSLAAVETPPRTGDSHQMMVSVGTTPIAQHPERFSQTRCRYACHAQVGSEPLAKLGIQFVLDAMTAFADAVGVRAGIALCADTTVFASCLVACSGSSSLTREQDQRVLAQIDGRSRWGESIRGPGWGTFLGLEHVKRLGGLDRIESASGCARVVPLTSGGAFLQLTSTETPLVEGHYTDDVLGQLALFLAPVM